MILGLLDLSGYAAVIENVLLTGNARLADSIMEKAIAAFPNTHILYFCRYSMKRMTREIWEFYLNRIPEILPVEYLEVVCYCWKFCLKDPEHIREVLKDPNISKPFAETANLFLRASFASVASYNLSLPASFLYILAFEKVIIP